MKHLVLIFAAMCCISMGAAAQGMYDREMPQEPARPYNSLTQIDLHLGEGLGQGAGVVAGADLALLHSFSPAFALGVGAGLDYFKALEVITSSESLYWGELTLPLFVRGRYTFGRRGMIGRRYNDGRAMHYGDAYRPHEGTHVFMQYDLGYRFCLTAVDFLDDDSMLHRGNVKGFFFEPQLGLSLGRNASVSIGLPFQGYDYRTDSVVYESAPGAVMQPCVTGRCAIGASPMVKSDGSAAVCATGLDSAATESYSADRKVLVAAVVHLTFSW